jgi:hypothetical protein
MTLRLEGANSVLVRTYVRVMHWRRQGDLGELSAMEWFASKGALICVPVGHSPDWDFVAMQDERLLRVQVKSAPSAATSAGASASVRAAKTRVGTGS